jgi:hypothetical protein
MSDDKEKETAESIYESEADEHQDEEVNESAESVSHTVHDASDAAQNALGKAMALKESNPKLFFGAIGGVVLLLILLMSSGGSQNELPVTKMANLSIGQTYQLRGVNTYDPSATIRLVAVPGSLAAYDDTEEDDRSGGCKHMPQGTKVKLVQVQEAFGSTKFVEVEILDGDCAGRKGWAVSTNLS